MKPQTGWVISRSWPIEPPSGTDHDAAYIVRLVDPAGESRDLIVEFAAPSSLTSVGYAEEIARKVRDRADLPRHVIVATDGELEIVGG
ncbi:MAG TPA: hypothetical protein VNR59_05345 [Gaiellaceae bacterium]|nr:hypothetical protein [Gaiellaceae bacterium]